MYLLVAKPGPAERPTLARCDQEIVIMCDGCLVLIPVGIAGAMTDPIASFMTIEKAEFDTGRWRLWSDIAILQICLQNPETVQAELSSKKMRLHSTLPSW